MIRLFHVYFPGRTLLLVISEALLVTMALLAATFVWFGQDTELALVYENGIAKVILASLVCMLCMYYYDLYDSLVLSNPREVTVRLIQVLGTVCVVLALVYYAYPVLQLRRGPFLLGIILAGLALLVWRQLFLVVNRSAKLAERTAVLGTGALARDLPREIDRRPELGLAVVGYLGGQEESAAEDGLRHLGEIELLPAVVERERLGRLILAVSDRRGHLPVHKLLQLKARGILVQDGTDVYEAITGKVHLGSLRPSALLFSDGFRVSRGMLLYKRAGSIVLSVLGLLLAWPVMALVALAIRLDSRGPVIFRQKRVGKDGKIFTLFKFRSMVDDADGEGPGAPAAEDDARCTRVGRYLRRARLDELPQLYNILRGDMYFIGPRPFMPVMEEECEQKIPFYTQRWTVKPGATGWAQVHRGYCASLEDNADKLSYDLFYIKNMSVGLDCFILFKTIKILLLGRGGR